MCKGSTADSDSVCLGSNPSSAAMKKDIRRMSFFNYIGRNYLREVVVLHYNFHTHTFRCNHASGKDREYVENAIAGGITKMGFSDHIPLIFPDGHESDYRIPTEKVDDYINSVNQLKEEYKDIIEIHLGFEMEYYPPYFEMMFKNAIKWGAEYLILGQHYIGNEYPNGASSTRGSDSEAKLCEYVDSVVSAAKTSVFSCIAHPDVFKFTGERETYIKQMRKICTVSKEYNIPLELNFLGIRDRRFYPTDIFWELAGEEQSPVIFAFDAHSPKDAYDGASLVKAKRMVEEYNLKLLPELKLVDIRKLQ